MVLDQFHRLTKIQTRKFHLRELGDFTETAVAIHGVIAGSSDNTEQSFDLFF
jgi:hypothetical protein